MNAKTSATILIILSIAFGGVIGILGTVGSDAVTTVAVIGGAILALLWVARGLLTRSANRG
ncbi:hypothetical protein LWC34_34630 [Kibdelosporangium philippinense]|uniref:Uncharacterized protein n=1 Tax=Kibdelosporangium philippinense TaxID=211113 RepID=A0ABS8ZJD1_9PSEU|nr:hypothetical protein [Kibdelosporangium philippinense]MCE7007920.1 hypothetical protein [Kibdelosporangium philippinense]